MTPCEKLGYKAGDRFEVIGDGVSTPIEVGEIITLYRDDGSEMPFFCREGEEFFCHCAFLSSLRPLKPQTEAEKRGAKFGTMGVVKPTGDKCIFIKENGYMWRVCAENGDAFNYVSKNIRLDHEPEYKEIPFSEATDEQRMEVGNLAHRNGHTITQIVKLNNGSFVYTINGFKMPQSVVSDLIVRVPA